jgi:hypothetical protein
MSDHDSIAQSPGPTNAGITPEQPKMEKTEELSESATLNAIEGFLVWMEGTVDKVKPAGGKFPVIEQQMNIWLNRLMEFQQNEINYKASLQQKNSQELSELKNEFRRLGDSYIAYLDKSNETAMSVLKIVVPIAPVVLAIKENTSSWFNTNYFQGAFFIIIMITLLVIGRILQLRKRSVDVLGHNLLEEIELVKRDYEVRSAKSEVKFLKAKGLAGRFNKLFEKLGV